MTRPRLPIDIRAESSGRRGGEWGTRAASGSPPSIGPSAEARLPASSHPVHQSLPSVLDEALLLEVPEVARLLGIGRTTVYQLIARRELPVICIGRCVRVPRAQLQRWIVRRTADPDAAAASESSRL